MDVATCMRSAETVALKTAFTIQLGYRSPVGCLKVNRSSNTPRQATTQRTRLFAPMIKVATTLKQYGTEEAMFHELRTALYLKCSMSHVSLAQTPHPCARVSAHL